MTSHLELPLGTREYVRVSVSSPEDLTARTVELAFVAEGSAPTGWSPATWVAGETNVARILVVEPDAGIAGAVELDAGYFDIWARITNDDERTLIVAGRLEIFEPGSETYNRWGMTVATAAAVTGAPGLSARDLERAEDEIRSIIAWAPRPEDYSTDTDDLDVPADRRVWAMGHAIAWHAAYRTETKAVSTESVVEISSESVGGGDVSTTYVAGRGPIEGGPIAPKARMLLARHGWLSRMAGHTRP